VYQVASEAQDEHGSIVEFTVSDLFRVIEEQAADGVDFMTVHCGVTLEVVERLKREGRIADIVSRGGVNPPRMDALPREGESSLR